VIELLGGVDGGFRNLHQLLIFLIFRPLLNPLADCRQDDAGQHCNYEPNNKCEYLCQNITPLDKFVFVLYVLIGFADLCDCARGLVVFVVIMRPAEITIKLDVL
jgi:hypothetical protein